MTQSNFQTTTQNTPDSLTDLTAEVTACQRQACVPDSCVFVSASAGSGKTKVLADRVLTLLLKSQAPERLLCLTFTKAAAAEMSNRITQKLSDWAIMPTEQLVSALTELLGHTPTGNQTQTARSLFATVLETAGGLKIMTIHSFCQSVLKRFPLEAAISPRFDVIDDITAQNLLSQALEQTLANFGDETLTLLSDYLNEEGLVKTLKSVLDNKEKLYAFKKDFPTAEKLKKELNKYYNLITYPTDNDIINEYFTLEEYAQNKLLYLKKDGGILKKYLDELAAHNTFDITEKLKNRSVINTTVALMMLAYHVVDIYETLKSQKTLLDYDDLILKTKYLLEKSDMASWVLFKLDGGIDHILVDEAQDTNKNQWAIVKSLAEEFFAGDGLPGNEERTLFAVGDKKQSIYSFQGANPAEFETMRLFFKEKVESSHRTFETIPLNISFRSTAPVLDLVNRVLSYPPAKQGVLEDAETAHHKPIRSADAGLVEIWPPEEATSTDKPEPWKPPVETQKNTSAVQRLAEKIADKIKEMIDNKEILESTGRPISPSDFMILVQRRRQLTTELFRALKSRNIPVAGLDRLILTGHIAVLDMIALMKFVLQPSDDLNLACILKSPLIDLTEDDLYRLAFNRGSASLWERLSVLYPEQHMYLNHLIQKQTDTPFEFSTYVLGPLGGRKAFISRLGLEATEALDEFLNLCLTYEQSEPPVLQNFIRYLSDKDIEIKRDLDQSTLDAVRIMTVHGSKGLQGNIVFLPDTRFVPAKAPSFLTDAAVPLWFAKSELKTQRDSDIFQTVQQEALNEYHRLLYVALTRAKDRLYIMAYNNKNAPKDGNWYDLIVNALGNSLKPDKDGIIRLQSPQINPVSHQVIQQETTQNMVVPLWATTDPTPESIPSRPLSPSKPDEEPAPESTLTPNQTYALRRGHFIHQLLQYLPDIAPNKRLEIANRLKPADMDIPASIFDLLEHSEIADLFSPQSLSEVPVVGVIGNKTISGQIDRLVIRNNEVLIVDFKTNRRVPSDEADVPVVYKNQMYLYKQLLKQIFPDKIIKTYLLWIENLTITELTL